MENHLWRSNLRSLKKNNPKKDYKGEPERMNKKTEQRLDLVIKYRNQAEKYCMVKSSRWQWHWKEPGGKSLHWVVLVTVC